MTYTKHIASKICQRTLQNCKETTKMTFLLSRHFFYCLRVAPTESISISRSIGLNRVLKATFRTSRKTHENRVWRLVGMQNNTKRDSEDVLLLRIAWSSAYFEDARGLWASKRRNGSTGTTVNTRGPSWSQKNN